MLVMFSTCKGGKLTQLRSRKIPNGASLPGRPVHHVIQKVEFVKGFTINKCNKMHASETFACHTEARCICDESSVSFINAKVDLFGWKMQDVARSTEENIHDSGITEIIMNRNLPQSI